MTKIQRAPRDKHTTKREITRLVSFTCYDLTTEKTTKDVRVQYVAYAEETCPTTGRKHLQGYAYGGKLTTRGWGCALNECGFTGVHVEASKGSIYDNATYCMKEGLLIELGVRPMRCGEKRVVETIKKELDNGHQPDDLMQIDDYFPSFAQHHKFYQHYANVRKMDALKKTGFKKKQIYIIWGPPGVGKSRSIFDKHGFDDVYIMPECNGQWFGNYRGQPVVVFNDVDRSSIMPLAKWLNICDGYPIEVPVKGGFTPWGPEIIYFTSNTSWENWWDWEKQPQGKKMAVIRRITSSTYLNAITEPDNYDGLFEEEESTNSRQAPVQEEDNDEASQDDRNGEESEHFVQDDRDQGEQSEDRNECFPAA